MVFKKDSTGTLLKEIFNKILKILKAEAALKQCFVKIAIQKKLQQSNPLQT